MAGKYRTEDQVQTAKERAVRFVRDVLGDEDRAEEIADESLDEYAERKGLEIIENPHRHHPRKDHTLSYQNMSKADLIQRLEEVEGELEEATDRLNSIAEIVSDEEDDEDEEGQEGEESEEE